MANKNLFKAAKTPAKVKVNPNKWVESKNEAGGAAFSFPDKLALAQFAVTGTLNNVFYATAESQLEAVKKLVEKVDSAFIAKLAVYAHQSAFMKDMPAYLLAVLHARHENELVSVVFDRVVANFKMLSNFVQIVRSGVTGRKSFGTSTKNLINNWLARKTDMQIFNGSIGLSDPSVADIIKMVHPKADSESRDAVYAYIAETRGYKAKMKSLPEDILLFEALKRGEKVRIPNIPFRALTNVELSDAQWMDIARNMPFNTLRQNLNMLERRGVFKNPEWLKEIADKLAKADGNVFPYQLFTTFQNTTGLPSQISNALQDAAEIATKNVPQFGDTLLFIDVSGSMRSSVTGYRADGTPPSKTTCVDVAGLMGACVLRNNKNATVISFDNRARVVQLNARDSIMTNAQKISNSGNGGTDLAAPMALANHMGLKADLVIYVSDNMSWMGQSYGTAGEWLKFKQRNSKAKLVNIDIQPYANAQMADSKDVLNIGGFSDNVFSVIDAFVNGSSKDFIGVIEEVEL